jgi:large subunit ribosomal protein L31
MRADIHPPYEQIQVRCSCGHVFTTGSALCSNLTVEVCNECHPFYTGKQKIMDTAGRVDKFAKKFGGFSLAKAQAADESNEATEGKA